MTIVMRLSLKLPRIRHIDKYPNGSYGILAILSYRSSVRTGVRRAAVSTIRLGFAWG
jgi:hypothetical protein